MPRSKPNLPPLPTLEGDPLSEENKKKLATFEAELKRLLPPPPPIRDGHCEHCGAPDCPSAIAARYRGRSRNSSACSAPTVVRELLCQDHDRTLCVVAHGRYRVVYVAQAEQLRLVSNLCGQAKREHLAEIDAVWATLRGLLGDDEDACDSFAAELLYEAFAQLNRSMTIWSKDEQRSQDRRVLDATNALLEALRYHRYDLDNTLVGDLRHESKTSVQVSAILSVIASVKRSKFHPMEVGVAADYAVRLIEGADTEIAKLVALSHSGILGEVLEALAELMKADIEADQYHGPRTTGKREASARCSAFRAGIFEFLLDRLPAGNDSQLRGIGHGITVAAFAGEKVEAEWGGKIVNVLSKNASKEAFTRIKASRLAKEASN